MPPLPPMPSALPKPNLTPPRIPGLPPMPALPVKAESKPATPPKMPGLPGLSSVPELPPTIPEVPKPEPKVVKQPSLARVGGMSDKHLIAQDAELKGMLLELDMSSGAAVIFAVGKFNSGETPNPAPSNYLDMIVPLTQQDQETAATFSMGYRPYVKPAAIPVLPTIPGLPPMPTLP